MKPIAMKCSLEQWEAIKPKLKSYSVTQVKSDFNCCNYLVNNFSEYLGKIGNVHECRKSIYNRKVYEEWNEDIFLEACDIKPIINKFKKNDYIVTLKGEFLISSCAKENYCFKQRKDEYYILPEIDLEGDVYNGNLKLTFDKNDYLEDWRYATPEEIAEYDRLGKPYDVTTLNKVKEWSVGSYVVFLEDNLQYNNFKKGSVQKICFFNGVYIRYANGFKNDTSNQQFYSAVKWFATKEEAEAFSKKLINQSNNFQLPEKWCCKLTVENADRFKKAYSVIIDNSFRFSCYNCYYSNSKEVYNEKPNGCVKITLEQMEEAACISDTINPDFDICNTPVYEFPRFKEPTVPDDFALAFELSLQATDKQLVNLTKPTLNRPKTKQFKTNLIKPIKPVKL